MFKKKEPKIKLLLSSEVSIMSDKTIEFIGRKKALENSVAYSQTSFNAVLRTLLNLNNYGEGVLDIGIIQIVGPEEDLDNLKWVEVKKYIPKDQDVEIRLRLDYEKFKKSEGEWDAIYENIIASLEAMKEIVPDTFDTDRLIDDFKKACVGLL